MSEVRAFAMGGGGPAADDPKLEPGGDYPRGFERITLGGVQLLTRTEALSWSRQAVLAHGSLYRAAQDSAHQTLRGRGPVPVLAHPAGGGSPWVVRRYYRGGFMRPLGDRFLRAGRPRSFTEVENSARISKLGFATPRIVAAAVYPTGLLYRADLVTEFVPQARTLADILLGGNADDPGAYENQALLMHSSDDSGQAGNGHECFCCCSHIVHEPFFRVEQVTAPPAAALSLETQPPESSRRTIFHPPRA